jgi:hypothetical protein
VSYKKIRKNEGILNQTYTGEKERLSVYSNSKMIGLIGT